MYRATKSFVHLELGITVLKSDTSKAVDLTQVNRYMQLLDTLPM